MSDAMHAAVGTILGVVIAIAVIVLVERLVK